MPKGKGPWRELFASLIDVRPWGHEDRVPPETLTYWRSSLESRPGEPVRFEVELWFYESANRRAQAQQRPSPLGGGIFKRDDWQRIKTADLPAKFSEIIQSWDCAFKDTRSSDFVVGQVWGIAGAGRYLLDQVRGHMSFSGTLEAIRQMSAKWPQATRKLVEDKANGTAVIDTLNSEIAGLIPVEPQGGKEARAHAVSAFVEAHNVYLPADAPWVAAFIEGAAQFPNGAHDDQVDGMTQAPNFLRGDGYWFFDLELMGNLWGVAKTAARALLPERSAEHDASDSGVATCATPEGIFKRQADAQMQVSIQADSRIAAVFGQNRKPVAAVKDTVKASSASTPARPQCGAFLSRRETPRGEKVETCNPCGWSNVIPPIVTERFDGTISNS